MNENVVVAADELVTDLKQLEEATVQKISQYVAAKDWGLVNEQTERVKQIQNFTQRAESLRNDCLKFFGLAEEVESGKEDSATPVGERTTWALIGDKIRSETTGGGTTYSNLVPTNLFFSLAMDAYWHIKLNGFVKTSHVLSASKEMIRQLSDYQSDSSIRLPVYVTFKVLVREGIFKKIDNHKYGLVLGKDAEFFAFLKKIDVAVTHKEAVRRLKGAGQEEMATALSDWENGKGGTSRRSGWDGAVSGESGSLYKRFGNEMRDIIWPYRYQ